ncbi:hypothetical protein [Psychrobacter sp. DM8]|uniref:hypothetical protein n=1 Tax=unclassified Psychrobacter TaxID=196806 RepID=UPI003F505E15
MYQQLPNTCYECGVPLDQKSLTREHVPPRCFFPKNDKFSLITVPSCIEHNGGKSDDDEHLLQIISLQILANEKGQNIATGKTVKSILRNRKRTRSLVSNATLVYVDEKRTGQLKPTFAFKFDESKFNSSISSICKGLYYYEFHKVFNGDIKIYNEFQISLNDDSINKNKEFDKNRILIEKSFSNVKKKGENQEIFYYQIMKPPKGLDFSFAIRLCFYEGIGILTFLQEKRVLTLNAITTAIIKVQQ